LASQRWSTKEVCGLLDICCRMVFGSESRELNFLYCLQYFRVRTFVSDFGLLLLTFNKASGNVDNVITIGKNGLQKWYLCCFPGF
jgi:hypothetical protein